MSATTLRASGARQHSDTAAEEVEKRLPEVLLGLLTVAPSASLALVLGSDAVTGIGVVALTVDETAQNLPVLAAEVETELNRPYTVERVVAKSMKRRNTWHIRPDSFVQAGFSVQGASSSPDAAFRNVDETFSAHFRGLVTQWLTLAIENPGLLLIMRFSFDPSASVSRQFRVWIRVASNEDTLPLRARSLVKQLFVGWAISDGDDAAVAMACDRATCTALAQLPISRQEPLPGILASASKPHPMQPTAWAPSKGIRLGSAVLPSGKVVDVHLDEAEQVRHTHLVGKTGTGKSTMLAALAHGFAVDGNGFFCADVTGELIPRIIAELPPEALERVWLIEAGDVENPVPLNAFAVDDPVELDIIIQDLVLMFYKLFDPAHSGIVGPRFEGWLTNGLRGLFSVRGTRTSLLDVPRIYRDRRLEAAVAAAVTEPTLIDFWRSEMRDLSSSGRSEITGWFASKFDRFSNTEAMRRILGTGADAFDPAKAMDEGRIILLDLSKRRLGEVAANMLGFLYITRLWSGFLSRKSSRPFGVLVDEAQSFSAGSLPSMLSEGRKWGASVAVAHQYLAQLDEPLREALDGNVATTIAFRAGAHDASEVLYKIGGSLSVNDITTQPDLRAILSRTSGRASAEPHTLIVDHGDRVTGKRGAELDKRIRRVREQSHRALVDPFRGLEPFNVSELETDRPARNRTPRPAARDWNREPEPGKSTFFDDWLTEHNRLSSDTGESVEPDDSVGSVDSVDAAAAVGAQDAAS
jgi:hypothetical protein